jgi:plasmid replication initiation protein
MNVPESYRNSQIKSRIIEPAVAELSKSAFPSLSWHFIKQKGTGCQGRGGKIVGVVFSFLQQPKLADITPYLTKNMYINDGQSETS